MVFVEYIKRLISLSRIAYRNIFRNFRRSIFSIIAIGIAVFFIIIAISYINGMIGSMENVIQTYESGQISVYTKEFEQNRDSYPLWCPIEIAGENVGDVKANLEKIEGVKGVFLRIKTFATLTNNIVKHGFVWGMDFNEEKKVSYFNITNKSDGLIIGRSFLSDEKGKGKNECIIGISLARKLGIIKEILYEDEYNEIIKALNSIEKELFEKSYKFNEESNLYNLSIGEIVQIKKGKKTSFKDIEADKKIMRENELIYKTQNKLLDIFIRYTQPNLQLKIISSQYSEKFINPKIVGIFDFDYEQYNSTVIIMPFDRVQKLATLTGKTQSITIYTNRGVNLKKTAEKIREIYEGNREIVVKEWFKEPKVVVFNQMKVIYAFIYVFFVVLASFLIINTMIMIINERIKEIGMMGSLGMTKSEIVTLFFLEALFLSFLGSFFGSVFSGFITFGLSFYPIKLLSLTGGIDMPISNTLFIDFSFAHLIEGFLIGIVISSCCTIFPSLTSVKVEPVEALRR